MKNLGKKIFVVAVFSLLTAALASASEKEGKALTAFGSLGYRLGVMDKKPVGMPGLEMGLVLWERLLLGVETRSVLPELDRRLAGESRTLQGGSGGLLIGINIIKGGIFTLGFQNVSGFGGYVFRGENGIAMLHYFVDSSLFGEWEIRDHLRLGLSLGNRVSYRVKDGDGLDADMQKGPFAGLYLKLGTF